MLSDENLKEIRRAADRTIGSCFEHLKNPANSTDLSAVIARAIANAIEEYDRIKDS